MSSGKCLSEFPDAILGSIAAYLDIVDLQRLCTSCGGLRRRRNLLWGMIDAIEIRTQTELTVLENLALKRKLAHMHTLTPGIHASDELLQKLIDATLPNLRTIAMVGSLQVTDRGLHSLSFVESFVDTLETIDITYCHGTSYAGTFCLRDKFGPNLLIRRLPQWMVGSFETPFDNDGLHTYYADGSFEFEREEQSCGYVMHVDKWYQANPNFVFDKLQYSNFEIPEFFPSSARFFYRPGVSLLRLNENEVLVGQTLMGLQPPLDYPRREHAHLLPQAGSSVYFGRTGQVISEDDNQTRRYYMVSRMRVFPLSRLMPPPELVEKNRELCDQLADTWISQDPTTEAAVESALHHALGGDFPSNGHSFCPHRSATTSSFLFLSLKPRLTFFHLFLPTSMPSLFWCGCCRAAEAVIVDTRQGIGEGGPRARRASTSSTSSLAYLDAVEAESELASLSLHFDRRSSTEDLFFDAEGGPAVAKEDEPTQQTSAARVKATKSKDRREQRVALQESQSRNQQNIMFEFEVKHREKEELDKDDLYLLAPEFRDGSVSTSGRRHRRSRLTSPEDMGFPGHLKPDQLKALQQLRSELKKAQQNPTKKNNVYREMVYTYSQLEPESYALCRYLRLYNFNVQKVFHHMDKSADLWNEAGKHGFYPNVVDAVGAPLSVLLTQFPSLYYGLSKQGYPCCYFNAGALSVEGIECVTDATRLANFIWHNMMHEMKYNYFPEAQKRHPEFKRLEQITILNLKGLSRSLFTPKVYHVLQQVDTAAAVFPEMLHSLIIINAPGFFSFFWSVISRFIDPKTANLMEIYSSSEKGQQRLLELIDEDELPSDYGGRAPSTSEIILQEGRTDSIPHRQVVELLHVGKEKQFDLKLAADERVELSIYTRSKATYNFTLTNQAQGTVVHQQTINEPPEESVPTCFRFGESIQGPGTFTMKAHASGHHSGKQYFLVIGEIFRN